VAEQLVSPDRPDLAAALSEAELQGPLREHVTRAFTLGSRAFRMLPASAVAVTRSDLADEAPTAGGRRRMLEFAPLSAPDPPSGLDLPDEFVATRLDDDSADVAATVADRADAVSLDGLDRAAQAAVLARSRGFVGTYGVEAVLAVLVGRPAVVLGAEHANPSDLSVLDSFLGHQPFGRLHTLDAAVSPAAVGEYVARLLRAPAEALARV
jgi:hypothetical protein